MEDNLNSFRPKYCSSQRRELIFCMQPYLNPTKWNMEEILKNLTMKDDLNFLVLRAAFPEPFFVYLLEGTGMSKWCSLLIKNNVTNQALIYIFFHLVKTEAEKGHPDAGSCFLVSWSCLVPGCYINSPFFPKKLTFNFEYFSILKKSPLIFWHFQNLKNSPLI